MEMRELFLLEEFQEYRRREIEIAADFLQGIWTDGDKEYIRGAVALLSRILAAPESYAVTDETKGHLQALDQRDFALFETKFLKRLLSGKDDE